MHDFVGDLRYALRTLVRQPGFAVVAAMSLALGIGLNTTIFSVVNAVLLKDLPIEAPDRLVEIYTGLSEDFPHLTTSFPDLVDVRAEADLFEGLAAHAMVRGIVTNDGRSELVAGEVVTANYFDLLGVRPALGRTFHEDEDETEGTHPVMILSHGLWQRRLGADAPAVLKMILRQGMVLAIFGVGVGAVLAGLLARVLQALLYGVSSVDPVSHGVAAFVLLAVALAANLIPAWRASRVSPMAALRYE
ncbi:MAG: hypothetical protein BMS9Abin37_2971 [Acidobacteriota bacterium]|nr:MAG: hypothetical protein BMS9Abin37_2971 [Acidobacteriota bacterium]